MSESKSKSKCEWRGLVRHASAATLAVLVAALGGFAVKLGSFSQTKKFDLLTKLTIFLALTSFFVGILYNFVDVLLSYLSKSHASKLTLEIKAKDGSVLATDLDPADVQKIAEIVEEAKGASQ